MKGTMKKSRKLWHVGVLVMASAGAIGCDEVVQAIVCDSFCDQLVNCQGNQNVTDGCGWEAGETDASVKDTCIDECNNALDDLTDKDRDAVADCTSCIDGRLSDAEADCNGDSFEAAWTLCSECSTPENDDFVNKFTETFTFDNYRDDACFP